MKASNPKVMIQAYRLAVAQMAAENMHYPLHLGVTEAGEGEDARIKSAIGIGALLYDGLGDTIRVSLTEDPWHEIPVCKDLVRRTMALWEKAGRVTEPFQTDEPTLDFYHYQRRDVPALDLGPQVKLGPLEPPRVIVPARHPLREHAKIAKDVFNAHRQLKEARCEGIHVRAETPADLEHLIPLCKVLGTQTDFIVLEASPDVTDDSLERFDFPPSHKFILLRKKETRNKFWIARQQIKQAAKLWRERDFVSAFTLASAAEAIVGDWNGWANSPSAEHGRLLHMVKRHVEEQFYGGTSLPEDPDEEELRKQRKKLFDPWNDVKHGQSRDGANNDRGFSSFDWQTISADVIKRAYHAYERAAHRRIFNRDIAEVVRFPPMPLTGDLPLPEADSNDTPSAVTPGESVTPASKTETQATVNASQGPVKPSQAAESVTQASASETPRTVKGIPATVNDRQDGVSDDPTSAEPENASANPPRHRASASELKATLALAEAKNLLLAVDGADVDLNDPEVIAALKNSTAQTIFTLSEADWRHTHPVGSYRRLAEHLRANDLVAPIWLRVTPAMQLLDEPGFGQALVEAAMFTGVHFVDGYGDLLSVETIGNPPKGRAQPPGKPGGKPTASSGGSLPNREESQTANGGNAPSEANPGFPARLEASPYPNAAPTGGTSAMARSAALAYNLLQGARMRAIKTEFVACPSCGRTLFNLQEVT
ncbi:MAG: flavodoxin-dependent (E)-4-hydroxy-3-methylbut-2-enyl-diphosphate synthase, partial [Opitutales bacterium]